MKLLSRREMMEGSVVCLGGLTSIIGCAADSKTETTYSDPVAADDFVKQWAEGKRLAVGALHLQRFADPTYIVTKEIKWEPNAPQADSYKPVTVPPGFVTDFASIPRLFWQILRPDGDYGYAAIIHDYLYWEQPVKRQTADEILRLAMQDFKVNAATIGSIYNAVRAGGGVAWKGNAKLKTAGEKRLLKRYPEDPTIRWKDWKKRDDVF